MRSLTTFSPYELSRLEDQISALVTKRDAIKAYFADSARDILGQLIACQYRIFWGSSVRVLPSEALKSWLPQYLGPQESYSFPIEDGFTLDLDDHALALSGEAKSLADKLAFIRRVGVPRESVLVEEQGIAWHEKAIKEALDTQLAAVNVVNTVFSDAT